MSELVKLLLAESAASTYGAFQRRRSSISRLVQHVQRSKCGRLKGWADRLIEFQHMAQRKPRLLESVEQQVERFLDSLQKKGLDEALVRVMENDLTDKISSLREENMACQGYLPDAECAKTHQKFVNKVEKALKVDVYRWDGVVEGLYVWFDEEDHCEVVENVAKLEELCAEHGYLLLNQGVIDDSGPFGCNQAKWSFMWCPTEDEPYEGFEEIELDESSISKGVLHLR